jgi:uncharacterized protein YhfF
MKTSTLFWGSLLIFAGILAGLEIFSIFEIRFGLISKFWPIILILLGILLFKIGKPIKNIIALISAFLVAWFVVASFASISRIGENISSTWNFNQKFDYDDEEFIDWDDSTSEDSFSNNGVVSFDDGIENVRLNINQGAGSMVLNANGDNLIDISSEGVFSKLNNFREDKNMTIDLDLSTKLITTRDKNRRTAKIKIHKSPAWEIFINAGASDIELNLADNIINAVMINSGASNIEATLGNLAEQSDIHIKAGASNIVLNVPNEVACSIETTTALSSKDFSDFSMHNGKYYSPDYKNYEKNIHIIVEGAMSNLVIRRY